MSFTTSTFRKDLYERILFVSAKEAGKYISQAQFIGMEPLFNDEDEAKYYQIHMKKKFYKEDVPAAVGVFILSYSKLRLLEMYYDFLDKFIGKLKTTIV